MTNRRFSTQIQSQLMNINRSLHTIDQHLVVGDHGRARLELEYITALITELHDRLSNLENIGRQPEETMTRNNITDYNNCIFVTLSMQ